MIVYLSYSHTNNIFHAVFDDDTRTVKNMPLDTWLEIETEAIKAGWRERWFNFPATGKTVVWYEEEE